MLIIRHSTDQDFENLTALAIQVWLHTYARDGIRDKISGYVLSRFTPDYFKGIHGSVSQKILVAEENSHLVGFITLDLEARCSQLNVPGYEIVTLYVQEFFQGKGIGTSLVAAAIKEYGKNLWLTTWVKNELGIRFYKKSGFHEAGIAFFDLEGEKHENFILAKNA